MTVSSTNTESLYDVLGVPENATPDDIKRAYFQLVRKYRPNEHPETFQRFNDARWILGDSPRRNKYDQMRRYGRRLKTLLDEANTAAKEDPRKAVPLLRSAVALAPALPLPRALLAELLVQTGEYVGAERQYRWLAKDSERDETLRYWLGYCLFQVGRPTEAENELAIALATNPLYHDALMLLSEIYQSTNRLPRAIATLEKAISNDGVENFLDFDALLQLLILHINSRNDRAIEKTARRLLSVVAIAGQSAAIDGANRMYTRAQILLQEGKTAVAGEVLRHTRRISISDTTLSAQIEAAARRVLLVDEAQRLCQDAAIPAYLKGYVQVSYLERVSDAKRGVLLNGMRQSIEAEVVHDPLLFRQSVERLKRSYASIAADLNTVLSEIGSGQRKPAEVAVPIPIATPTLRSMPTSPQSLFTTKPEPGKPRPAVRNPAESRPPQAKGGRGKNIPAPSVMPGASGRRATKKGEKFNLWMWVLRCLGFSQRSDEKPNTK